MGKSRRTVRVLVLASFCGCAGGVPKTASPPPPPSAARASAQPRIEREPPHPAAAASPVLTAMQAELARTMTAFRAQTARPAPYFLAYELTDEQSVSIMGSMGALFDTTDSRSRTLDVDVRVGSPQEDNTHPLRDANRSDDLMNRWGRGFSVPIEDDLGALRERMWVRTDEQYRKALERLAKVRAQKQVKVAEEDASDDFSVEAPATDLEDPVALEVDRAEWEKRVRDYSALFKGQPDVLESNVRLSAELETRWYTSSDGGLLQTPRPHVLLSISASAKADDGMELERYESFEATSIRGLPGDAQIRERIRLVIEDLAALRNAPLAEPWSGPAILDGRAAGVFFHEVFGHRMEGHRQKDEGEGQTFAKKIGEKVMPDFISVYDDPTIAALDGIQLNGHYLFDDEGVPGQRAELVDKGVLKSFLMSRSPVHGFARSNGHGRRQKGMSVVARQGNLVVEPLVTAPATELKTLLLAEIARQHKPYGLRFREIQGGYTNTGRGGPQAFKVLPIVVYRVYPDGHEEMVRGVDLEGTPLTSLSKILAAGDDYQVFNGHCGAESGFVPVAAVSPSLLIGQIETARKEKEHERPPILPPPDDKGGGS
jgi:predicted Zn-dependent protease